VIGKVVGLVNCVRGKHDRSSQDAIFYLDTNQCLSICRHCGIKMRRRASRDWIVDR
jgi:hypothetical protein